jgi:uncharacterized protein (DUF433 family)
MPLLDWSQCQAVESIPGKVSGAWVFRDTRMPMSVVFDNLEAGATIDEIVEWFDVTPEEVRAVIEFPARSLDTPVASRSMRVRSGRPRMQALEDTR